MNLAKQAREFEVREATPRRIGPGFQLDPDYESHPAYGGLFPKPTVALRVKALARLLPWMLFLGIKRALFGDRLSRLPGHDCAVREGIKKRAGRVVRYLPFLAREIAIQIGRSLAGASGVEGSALLDGLERDGIAINHVPFPDFQALKAATAGPVAELLRHRGSVRGTGGATGLAENQKWLDRAAYAQLYELAGTILARQGVMAAAGRYLGREVRVTRLLVQVNDPGDRFFHGAFRDAGLPDPASLWMHLDTTYGVVKCMIYLSDVSVLGGPFSYVLGSHRLRRSAWDGLIRRAMDRSRLAWFDPAARRLFMALPRALRRKSQFGSDWMDSTEGSKRLLEVEYQWISEDGNLALFDNLGAHRGGMVREGRREVLFAVLG